MCLVHKTSIYAFLLFDTVIDLMRVTFIIKGFGVLDKWVIRFVFCRIFVLLGNLVTLCRVEIRYLGTI